MMLVTCVRREASFRRPRADNPSPKSAQGALSFPISHSPLEARLPPGGPGPAEGSPSPSSEFADRPRAKSKYTGGSSFTVFENPLELRPGCQGLCVWFDASVENVLKSPTPASLKDWARSSRWPWERKIPISSASGLGVSTRRAKKEDRVSGIDMWLLGHCW